MSLDVQAMLAVSIQEAISVVEHLLEGAKDWPVRDVLARRLAALDQRLAALREGAVVPSDWDDPRR